MGKKKLIILGGGESGVGAAILGKDRGFEVFLSDSGAISEKYCAILRAEGITFEQMGHSRERILAANLVVKSPGIPPTAPLVKELADKGTPIISEIEFAGRYTDAKMVCITGSNGKTTTTTLITHILRAGGVDASPAGNIGRSLAWQVAREPHAVYVVELSSFQLENMYDFKANIAILMNITPDHLDRYEYDMQNYVNAKFRIIRNMTPQDVFIYWQDDPIITRQLQQLETEATLMPFGENHRERTAAYVNAENDLVLDAKNDPLVMPRADLALNGLHNLYNSMAAGLSAQLLNVKNADIRRALGDFQGVEHRLEYVATINGTRWINDSKATNVNSTWYALESMPASKTTVLILGGKDKGNDYSEILPLVRKKVKAIVAMGLHNEKIVDFFKGEVPRIVSTDSLDAAIAACNDLADRGDTVLLSPCCASFDLFTSYENRGELFKAAVNALKTKSNN